MTDLTSKAAVSGMRAGRGLLGRVSAANDRILQSFRQQSSPDISEAAQTLLDAFQAAKAHYDAAQTDQERAEAAECLDVMAEEIIVRTDIPLAIQTVIAGDYMASGRVDPEVQASAFLCVYDTAKREAGS